MTAALLDPTGHVERGDAAARALKALRAEPFLSRAISPSQLVPGLAASQPCALVGVKSDEEGGHGG